jgi:DNA-directed RNA polymerase subunit K/omega
MRRLAILLIGGSLNQTTMMHRIALELPEHDCYFSPYYADGLVQRLADAGWLDFTILGTKIGRRSLAYLRQHGLAIDLRGAARRYDLVVTGSDLIVPRNVRGVPLVLVQEGMMDPENYRYRLVRALGLPRYLANTSMTGLSHAYERFCVASPGYRDAFVRKGVAPEKLVITGIPNFDDMAAACENDFPHRHYVLAATSCLRETFKYENRRAFIRRAREIAGGRPLIFKLHPNERIDRARREIKELAPEALVFAEGNTHHMVANCDVLVTRYSSVVYFAVALGKQVYADLPLETLRALTPIQNGGTSARRIAEVCRECAS